MNDLTCHECGEPMAEATEIWLAPETGRPDETAGEPYCAGCASPMGIAA